MEGVSFNCNVVCSMAIGWIAHPLYGALCRLVGEKRVG